MTVRSEGKTKMGKPGTPERDIWVAGCVMRDLTACAEHPGLSAEDARGYFKDGAEALRRLIALLSEKCAQISDAQP